MSGGFLTVSEAAERLCKSERAVRTLVKREKLLAFREKGRLRISEPSLSAYVDTLPHPPYFTALMYQARTSLAFYRYWRETGGERLSRHYSDREQALYFHYLPHAEPLYKEVLAALSAKDYGRAVELAEQLGALWDACKPLYSGTVSREVTA